jgi:TRAP-type C4-dicarboxylate transport system permease small subunit
MEKKNWLGRVSDRIGETTSLAFIVIVAISAYEVVMRYAFAAPTSWVHEISVTLAAAAFAIGGPYVHDTRQHIAITFFFDRMPPRARRAVRVLQSLLIAAFLALLTWTAGKQALVSIDERETSGTALNWPTPMFVKTVFALCCLYLLVQSLVHIWVDIRASRSRP